MSKVLCCKLGVVMSSKIFQDKRQSTTAPTHIKDENIVISADQISKVIYVKQQVQYHFQNKERSKIQTEVLNIFPSEIGKITRSKTPSKHGKGKDKDRSSEHFFHTRMWK